MLQGANGRREEGSSVLHVFFLFCLDGSPSPCRSSSSSKTQVLNEGFFVEPLNRVPEKRPATQGGFKWVVCSCCYLDHVLQNFCLPSQHFCHDSVLSRCFNFFPLRYLTTAVRHWFTRRLGYRNIELSDISRLMAVSSKIHRILQRG